MGLLQALHLAALERSARLGAEVRARAGALRWRLELDRALLNLNESSMQRALEDTAAAERGEVWSALYEPAGRRLAATARAEPVAPAELAAAARAEPDEEPLVRQAAGGRAVALARLTTGERELVLAVGFGGGRVSERVGGIAAALWADLFAVSAAALLLAARGLTDLLGRPRAAGAPPPAPPTLTQ